ncbi:MAG: hypothetical protein H0V81_10180 [Solirubrobacterales bacterium]|nr:hypothetical protein [Solirubrobacterales bacterium]
MGKRDRKRRSAGKPAPGAGGSFADLGLDLELTAPDELEPTATHVDAEGRELALRTVMSPGTRKEYTALLRGERSTAAAAREDVWHRAVEFLFERLAVRWTVADVATEGQAALLTRLRAATREERASVRDALRAHVPEHFPELDAP